MQEYHLMWLCTSNNFYTGNVCWRCVFILIGSLNINYSINKGIEISYEWRVLIRRLHVSNAHTLDPNNCYYLMNEISSCMVQLRLKKKLNFVQPCYMYMNKLLRDKSICHKKKRNGWNEIWVHLYSVPGHTKLNECL